MKTDGRVYYGVLCGTRFLLGAGGAERVQSLQRRSCQECELLLQPLLLQSLLLLQFLRLLLQQLIHAGRCRHT